MWTWIWLRGELVREAGGETAPPLPQAVPDVVLVYAIGEWVTHTSLPALLGALGERQAAAQLAELAAVTDSATAGAARLSMGRLYDEACARRPAGEAEKLLCRVLLQAQSCVSYREAHPTINQFGRYLSLHVMSEPWGGRDPTVLMRPYVTSFAALLANRGA